MIELKIIKKFPCTIVALDEAGRGPLAGPVIVGALKIQVQNKNQLKQSIEFLQNKKITDSKKLSESKRKQILDDLGLSSQGLRTKQFLHQDCFIFEMTAWEVDVQTIDKMNILGASLFGMREASKFLCTKNQNHPIYFLIDGNQKLRWSTDELTCEYVECPIIKGDSKSTLIGLASILAKVTRDEEMEKLNREYPQYGFATHFGYPTKAHRELIQTFGPSPIHRKTFKGVREWIVS